MELAPKDEDHEQPRLPFLWDSLGCLIALLYALPSLALPFGRDQGAFWYVARVWRGGGLPYVAAVDHKPPAIYGFYALAQGLFGENTWGVHLLEVLAIFPLAYIIVLAAFPRKPRPKGALGLSAMLYCALYFQSFNFWGTAQAEFGEGAFLLLALVFARRGAGFLCGASVAQACLFKLTAVIPGLLPFGVLLKLAYDAGGDRPLAKLAGAAARYFVGGLGLVAIWLLPFALGDGLGALWETVVLFNLEYAQRDDLAITTAAELWSAFYPVLPIWALLGGVVLGRSWLQKRPLRVGGLVVFLGLCIASVVVQGKLFTYHWAVASAGAVALFVAIVMADGRVTQGRGILLGGLMLALVWFGGEGWSGSQMTYRRHCLKTWNLIVEEASTRSGFLVPYHGPKFYRPSAVYGAAEFIKGVMKPGYTFCAEGFEPVFYVHLQGACPSPFFAIHILHEEKVSGRWDGWRERHRLAMEASPPDVIIQNHVQEELGLNPPGPDEPYEFLFATGTYSVLRLRGSPYAR